MATVFEMRHLGLGEAVVEFTSKKYTVGNDYSFLIAANQQHITDDNHASWHRDVPSKVNILCVASSSQLPPNKTIDKPCVGNYGNLDDATHLFLHCD